jgi:adenylosuccinate lyase
MGERDLLGPPVIPNVLAERYASPAMQAIWSAEGRIRPRTRILDRGHEGPARSRPGHPAGSHRRYEKVKDQVDPASIMARERVTRHDVKARIEEFCDLAGHEHVHKGMTSRDLTENVEQLQVYRALLVIRVKAAAALASPFPAKPSEFRDLVITARTHNVAAQPTTYGKRIAMFGEELLNAFQRSNALIGTYPVRGLKGAVGTQLDQLTLFAGDTAKSRRTRGPHRRPPRHPSVFTNVGQVYPRSLDFEVVAALNQLASAPSSFCKTLRLMAGHELASEGFAPGQVGSSAMPHKMNSRSCERVNGFHVILKGYLAMAADLAGDQWNEGDVSCSVVRRVMLPDAFFAARRPARDLPHHPRPDGRVSRRHRRENRALPALPRSAPPS